MSFDDYFKNDPLRRLQDTLAAMDPTRLLREQDPFYRMRELMPDLSVAANIDRILIDSPAIDITRHFTDYVSAAADPIQSVVDGLILSNTLLEAVANPISESLVKSISRIGEIESLTQDLALPKDVLGRLAARPSISFAVRVRLSKDEDIDYDEVDTENGQFEEEEREKTTSNETSTTAEPSSDFSALDLPPEIHQGLVRIDYLPLHVHRQIIRDQEQLFSLSPRQFEEYIADLLSGLEFEVELTPQSADGGRDLIGIKHVEGIPLLFAFECKQYNRERPIGPHILRALLGTVKSRETPANIGVLVTTSYFSRGSRELILSEPTIDGKDFDALAHWIQLYAERKGLS